MGIISILFISCLASITIVGFSLHYGISPMPTSRKARQAIFSLLPARRGTIFELGSGWGNLVFPLAKNCPDARIQAFEGSPLPWLFSTGVHQILRFPNLKIQRKNFFHVSLDQADGVVCYLYPGAMKRLKKKFEEELKPGAFVITNTFAIPGWTPEKVLQVNDLWCSEIYLYTCKKNLLYDSNKKKRLYTCVRNYENP